MRKIALLGSWLMLAGCSSMTFNPYDPTTPDTSAGRATADDQRSAAELRCGAGGSVTQRDDTNGTRAGDWQCERPKPR